MARCASKKAHWEQKGAALDALDRIRAAPPDPKRLYQPVAVLRCSCGAYVLTGSPQHKPGGRGKSRRDRGRIARRSR
jgi:hypothetical protein